MKKIYALFLVLFAFVGLNAQTVVLSEDFSAITDSSSYTITNSLDTYTQVPGWVGDWVYPNYGAVKLGRSSSKGYLQTPALDLSANNGQFTVSFDARSWGNDAHKIIVYVDDTPYTVEGLVSTSYNTFTLSMGGGTASSIIKFEGFQNSGARFFLDNVVITSQLLGPDTIAPFVASVTPSANAVNVTFSELVDATSSQTVANYSLDNNISITSATSNGRVVTLAVTPALTEGSTYTLVVSNVSDTAGNTMSVDTVVFDFGVSPEFQVATVAELRSKMDFSDITANTAGTVEYKLTGEVVVTAVASYNNQKVLQDATGAILVYDPGNNLGSLEVGDKVKDLYGTLTNYYGFLEFKPTQAYGERVGMFEDVEPLVITLAQLNDQAFMAQHQAELIKLNNVTFTSTGSFATLTTYEISQDGLAATAVFPYFQDASTIGQDLPMGVVNITGFNFATGKIGNNYPDYRYYIVPRSMNDFTTGIQSYISENDVMVSPNPADNYVRVSVDNDNFQVSKIFVVDITGKVVATQSVEENSFDLNVSNLSSGCYFIRLTDGKSNVTTKFIKK